MKTLLFHLVLLTVTILPVSSTLWFLRGTSSESSSSSSTSPTGTGVGTTGTGSTTASSLVAGATDWMGWITSEPYDDLITCMWNGTTVGACHALGCKWCHSSFSDICVTDEYAAHLDGSVFHCEGQHPTTDDDATPPPANDDAVVTPTPTPAPTTETPTPAPAPTDDVLPVTDDDPNHDANDNYMKRLLHCMAIVHGGAKACSADKVCTWCAIAGSTSGTNGMCFSHQAAKEMNGAYYQCDMTTVMTATM